MEDRVITGDALFVGYIGRADLPGSDPEQLYHTLMDKLGSLPETMLVYPGHDYGISPVSTIKQEKESNPYFQVGSKEEFIELRRQGI